MTLNAVYTTLESPTFEGKSLSDCQVLVVDDERSSCLLISTILSEIVHCDSLHDPAKVIESCKSNPPDLIILDINMPLINGIDLCGELRNNSSTALVPIVFITGDGNAATQDKCWQAGASDFVKKPVVASTLIHRVKNLLQSKLRLELLSELTFKDQLTGLYNRYYLFTEIPTLLKRLAREQKKFSVMMLDIDYFKGFNDKYGHIEGDKCLRRVAQALKSQLLRPQDSIVRYGGEEFAVFLPDTDEEGCLHVGHKMIDAVAALGIHNTASPLHKVTISAGYVVTQPNSRASLENILQQADLSLYEAKLAGKAQLKGSVNTG